METLTEGSLVSDVDIEMTSLTAEDIIEQHPDDSDEVKLLQNSLREAVHDDTVRPMMQCLMMDSSFSMVTMQGEDSGIAWEMTPSLCATPWASSEAGNPSVDLSSLVAVRPATPGSGPAGKITFVMDEELLSRRNKTKERVSGQKSKAKRHGEVFVQSSEDISGRPELVGVSQPNVKAEKGDEEEPNDPLVNKEQRLFSLVSEGSEILNIVVPPRLYTVDEEESKEMVDNLSYLVESPVSTASDQTGDYELVTSTAGSGAAGVVQVKPSASDVMDPPGAPVARPLGITGNVDYFEAYTLIDAQAPGSPAVVPHGLVGQEARVDTDSQDTKKPQSKDNNPTATPTVDEDKSDTVSLGEITCQLLDDVFYGGTENNQTTLNRKDGVAEGTPSRLPLKPSGSTLFGSQEDILTPIFLPEGPLKIIDPILLEEPKAMAFLYTDLYEEAIGSREREEDAESMTSEKSFHSRHSDREARGYLEKYVLIDETPVVEVEQTDEGERPEEGLRVLSQDLYEFGDFLPKPEIGEMPSSEEEITDFFRSSANSSPRDKEPFVRSLEEDEDEAQSTTKARQDKGKTDKNVSVKIDKVAEIPTDPLSISSFEFPSEETYWGSTDDYTLDEKHEQTEFWRQHPEEPKPVAPPRRKATSSPKACLDLTPLIPIDAIQEKEETGGNERTEEERETATQAEAAEEGDGERVVQTSCGVAVSESPFAVESTQTESVNDGNQIDTKPAADTETLEDKEMRKPDAATKEAESKELDMKSSESAKKESHPEKRRESSTGQCIIL